MLFDPDYKTAVAAAVPVVVAIAYWVLLRRRKAEAGERDAAMLNSAKLVQPAAVRSET